VKLVASLIVRNEAHRYLTPCLEHLLGFCDEVRVVDDASDDGSADILAGFKKVRVRHNPDPAFYQHEGHARQALLEWTLEGKPSYVLAVDADEFISDGPALRAAIVASGNANRGVWRICMEEVWEATEDALLIRADGKWGGYRTNLVYAARLAKGQTIPAKQLASGRVPMNVARSRSEPLPLSVYHFGWANVGERERRYQRYVEHDGGRFHDSRHLASIMWGPDRVRTLSCPWPEGLSGFREMILGVANPYPGMKGEKDGGSVQV